MRLKTNSAAMTNMTAPSVTAVRCTHRPRRPEGSTKIGRGGARCAGQRGSAVDIHSSKQPDVGRPAAEAAGGAESQSEVWSRLERESRVQGAEPWPIAAADPDAHRLDPS